jgi:hypothetical protein
MADKSIKGIRLPVNYIIIPVNYITQGADLRGNFMSIRDLFILKTNMNRTMQSNNAKLKVDCGPER